ncbi:MAG: alpha/beta fold hydrolase [Syntrophaceae bacterium]|nr:alpha/beta fold hydrolase [Syntrophaceae bacterium]
MQKEDVRSTIAWICRQRGVADFYDRFEADAVMSGEIRLHLDVIPVDTRRPTVVFMPGTNAYAMLYGEFLTALADEGYNIVGFDPRGHGRSGGRRGSYTMPELLTDMLTAVDYARQRFGDPVAIAGSSQGGITAFYAAASGTPMACAICHNAADLSNPDSVRLTRYPFLGRLLKPAAMRMARVLPELKIPMIAYLNLKAEPVRNMGSAKDLIDHDPLLIPYIRLKTMASMGSDPPPCPVEEIKTPVMILHAGADGIFPTDYIQSLYARLTCKKDLRIYEGLPHYIIVDHIDKIMPDILRWLEDTCA